ncbi:MAG: MFS transporter [Acetobacteraceae bacterium]
MLFYLTDSPETARWLPADERAWLVERLASERHLREAERHYSIVQALLNPRVLLMSLVYFGAVACLYGLGFFLPMIVKDFGLSNLQTGFVTALPYVVGTVGMVWWGKRSDRRQERKGHAAFAIFLAAAGIAASTQFADPVTKMILLSVASFGIFASLPIIWTLPTAFLSGSAAAAGSPSSIRSATCRASLVPMLSAGSRTPPAATRAAC